MRMGMNWLIPYIHLLFADRGYVGYDSLLNQQCPRHVSPGYPESTQYGGSCNFEAIDLLMLLRLFIMYE